jgi:hypothetical protein
MLEPGRVKEMKRLLANRSIRNRSNANIKVVSLTLQFGCFSISISHPNEGHVNSIQKNQGYNFKIWVFLDLIERYFQHPEFPVISLTEKSGLLEYERDMDGVTKDNP